ncbi:MAG: hypothetical protein OIF47_16645 [Marinibacterium sp.]|nr:hypothetical protein [Marinibacterium sp.]
MFRTLPLPSLLLSLFVLLASCTVSLLPPYDGSLVARLNELNQDTMTLFAGVGADRGAGQFPKYETQYNTAIGGFEAARQQAEIRELPPLGRRLGNSERLSGICPGGNFDACLQTTPDALELIVETLTDMRDQHRARGLSDRFYDAYREEYVQSITSALSVEAALER